MNKLILLIFTFNNIFTFKDISEVRYFIDNYIEFPKYGKKIESANFENFYKSILKSKKKIFTINPEYLKYSLNNLEDISIELNSNSKLILWGDIQSGFHGFARSIIYLFEKKVIDKDFKILDQNSFIIFNGNIIGHGPYPVETLSLVLNIINKNKGKAFYIKGQEELFHTWTKRSLQQEINIYKNLDHNLNCNSVKNFLESLPKHISLRLKNSKDLLSVSYFQLNSKAKNKDTLAFIRGNELSKKLSLLNQKTYAPNFYYGQGLYRLENISNKPAWTTQSCAIELYRMKYNLFYDSFIVIDFGLNLKDSLIKIYFNKDRSKDFKEGFCYNLFGDIFNLGENPLKGIIDFNFDLEDKFNFLVKRKKLIEEKLVYLESILKDKTLDLKIENIYIKDKDLSGKLYKDLEKAQLDLNFMVKEIEKIEQLFILNNIDLNNIDLNKKIKLEKRDNKLTIGSSASLTKVAKSIGKPLRQGLSLAITDFNKSNLNSRFIKLVFLNDKYSPNLFENNIKNLIYNYKTDILIIPEGTENILNAFDFIEKNSIFVFFPKSGASFLRNPKLNNIINFRPSFSDESRVLLNYIINQKKDSNFLFFYQDDNFGLELLKAAESELKKNGIKNWSKIAYQNNITSLKKAALKMKESNADTIGFFSLGPAAISIARELGADFFANKFLFGSSSISDSITLRLFDRMGLKLLTSEVVPSAHLLDYQNSSEPEIVKEYRKKLNKYGYKPNNFSLEAYICASIFIEQILKIKDSISPEKIMKNMENIKNYNFKGLKLNFNKENRTLSSSIWIKTLDGKYIEKNL